MSKFRNVNLFHGIRYISEILKTLEISAFPLKKMRRSLFHGNNVGSITQTVKSKFILFLQYQAENIKSLRKHTMSKIIYHI